MTELQLTHTSADAAATITIRGEIDMASSPELRGLLDSLLDAGATSITLECSALEFLDSSGIGVLVAAHNRLGDGGSIEMVGPPAHVRRVLEITGVDAAISIVD